MDAATRFSRLDSLFAQARDLPDDALRTFLAGVADADLRAELTELVLQDRAGTPSIRTLVEVGVALDEAAEPAQIPESIGGYAVLGLVGQGSSGVVLRARQPETDRIVAVKVLDSGAWNPGALARFRREVRLLGRLEHSGIARVYGAGTDATHLPARPFFVMEFVEGVPLSTWVRTRGLGLEDVLQLFLQVADAIGHAHACGIVHRDLKPGNVLVTPAGLAKIVDFGVAGVVDADATEGAKGSEPTMRSMPGELVGTVPYMSPEQFGGTQQTDARSDLYAIGVMLYEALSGRMPYAVDRRNIVAAATIVRDEVPTSLGRLDRSLSGDVETVVAKLLEKEPARRYQTARELAGDLQRILDGQPTHARPLSRGERSKRFVRRYRVPLAAVTAAFVTLTALLTWTAHLWRVAEDRGDSLAETLADRSRSDYRRTIGFAEASLRAGNVADARAALDGAEQARRGWEWSYLHRRAAAEVRATPLGMLTCSVRSAGGTLAVADNGTGHVWMLDSPLAAPRDVLACDGLLRDLALSPDGTEFIVAESHDGVTVHRASDGAAMRSFASGIGPETRVAWSPDGRTIACAGVDGAVAVLDAADGKVCLRVPAERARPFPAEGLVAYLPGSNAVVRAIATDDELTVWPLDGGEPMHLPLTGDRVDCIASCESPDGDAIVLAGTLGGLVHRFDARTGDARGALTAHLGSVKAIVAGPGVGHFTTGGTDAAVHCWDAATGARIGSAVGSERMVRGIAIDMDAGMLAAVGHDNHLRVWSIASGVVEPVLSGHRAWVFGLAYLADGTLVSCAGEKPDRDGRMIRWDTDDGVEDASLEVEPSAPLAVLRDVASDGRGGAVAAYWLPQGGGITFLDRDGARTVHIERGAPCSVAGIPGLGMVAWRSLDSPSVKLMSPGGIELQELLLPGTTRGRMPVRVRPRGDELVTATDEGLAVISLRDGRLMDFRVLPLDGHITDIAVCGADRLVAVGFEDGSTALVDPDAPAGAGVRWRNRTAHASEVRIARTPDGTRIASAGDQLIRIWDSTDGNPLLNLAGHGDTVLSLAFSPDGQTLASGSIDRSIRLWEAGNGGRDAEPGAGNPHEALRNHP